MASEEAVIKRVMPHNGDAEKAVIGSMLMDEEALAVAAGMISGSDFYLRQYGVVFDAMVGLYSEGKPVDPLTLTERLRMMDMPEEFTGPEFIGDLLGSVPTSANVRQYAGVVEECAMLRRLIKTCSDIETQCYQRGEPVEEIMEGTEKRIFEVLSKKQVSEYVPIKDVVLSVIDRIDRAGRNKGDVTGLASGFTDLDYKTSGFQTSDLVLIAARPSMGKTAFALNIAQHVCLKKQIPVVIFSLEMSKEQLVSRMLSSHAYVESELLRSGNLKYNEWERVIDSAGVISSSPLIIDDTPGISISELRSKCRKYKLENDLGLVIVDYLQLMNSGRRSESRQQEISEISRSLKAIAREIQVPVIALSQLSRAPELRQDHRPLLSDLRESGAIEQDADVVMFLYRDDYYNKDSMRKNVSEVIIAKQRNGPVGTVELAWMPQYTLFGNLKKRKKSPGGDAPKGSESPKQEAPVAEEES